VAHIIHTADWQIGRQYGQFEIDDAAMLAEARYETVARIASLSAERHADAIVVAGDVFDTQAVSDRTIRRLFEAMSAFKGPWVLIAGNHDAALADSVWSRAHQLGCIGQNVHIPLRPGVVDLPAQNLAVLAAPLTQRHTYDDTTAIFDSLETQPGRFRVGLAHGSVSGKLPDTIDSANPIAADRALRARLDYLALGDWHGTLNVDARTWYAGTPEADRFRSNDNGNILDVRLAAPGALPDVTSVAVGRYRWSLWAESMQLVSDAEAFAVRLRHVTSDDVVRVELSGQLPLGAWDVLNDLLAQAAARCRALLVDTAELSLVPDTDDLSSLGMTGYVSDVAAQLQALQGNSDAAETARHALKLLVQFQRDKMGAL